MPPSVIIYSLGPGAVHIPPIKPTKIAKMNTIPTGSAGIKAGTTTCRCHGQTSWTGAAAGIGMHLATQTNEAWCACGCHISWPAGGGVPGTSSYCNNWAKCCAGGSGQGGSGIVKITFV